MTGALLTNPIFTVGHSSRSGAEFIEVLRSADILTLVDVRRFPGSRRHPHFSIGPLREALASVGIAYHHLPDLGGYRERTDAPPLRLNDGWPEGFLRSYADYARSPPFRAALDRLHQLSARQTVLMCAERQWTDCHRQILADYLLTAGHRVVHLLDSTTREEGRLTPFAEPHPDGTICYPASPGQLLFEF